MLSLEDFGLSWAMNARWGATVLPFSRGATVLPLPMLFRHAFGWAFLLLLLSLLPHSLAFGLPFSGNQGFAGGTGGPEGTGGQTCCAQVVSFGGALLAQAEGLLRDGLHTTEVATGYANAGAMVRIPPVLCGDPCRSAPGCAPRNTVRRPDNICTFWRVPCSVGLSWPSFSCCLGETGRDWGLKRKFCG